MKDEDNEVSLEENNTKERFGVVLIDGSFWPVRFIQGNEQIMLKAHSRNYLTQRSSHVPQFIKHYSLWEYCTPSKEEALGETLEMSIRDAFITSTTIVIPLRNVQF
ncbi:hypothetical protein HAX54_032120 [Datura stramonium]|uniref:Uncharacterized protein n=1 Tax=Datura stramonium TaxID=4076 RepID=A0ABS8VBM1_DATST|nr:hypothetical protein [Datura stramonium]